MKILCLDQFAQLGGGQLCLLNLLPAFLRNGWEVRAMAPGDGEYTARLRALDCDVDRLALPELQNGRKTFTNQFSYVASVVQMTLQLRKVLREWRPDLVYANGPRVLPATALVCRETGVPLVFHAHHRIGEGRALRLVQTSLNAAGASVIACCSYVAASLTSRVRGNRVTVIYNGVSDHRQSPSRRTVPIKRVGIVGRIDPEKGQLDFIRAARIASGRFHNVQFHVVGSPQFSSGGYFSQVSTEGKGLPIHFHGWRDDISSVLGDLDLLVVSSPGSEATPRVILEALSAGVPVLAYRLGGIPEIIEDNRTGFLTSPTPEALASRMSDIFEIDAGALGLIVQRARLAWQERFHIDHWRTLVCDYLAQTVFARRPEFEDEQPQMTA